MSVANTDELVAALKSAPEGATIRLAAGSYTPPVATWTNPGGGSDHVSLCLRGKNLVGEGSEATRILLSGTGAAISVYGKSSLRRVGIKGGDGWTLFVSPGSDFSLCNSTLTRNVNKHGYGIYFQPWEAGEHLLFVEDSDITCDCAVQEETAIFLDGCGGGAQSIAAFIDGSTISGWEFGVRYYTENMGCESTISVTGECAQFSSNTHNIVHTPGGDYIEDCPPAP